MRQSQTHDCSCKHSVLCGKHDWCWKRSPFWKRHCLTKIAVESEHKYPKLGSWSYFIRKRNFLHINTKNYDIVPMCRWIWIFQGFESFGRNPVYVIEADVLTHYAAASSNADNPFIQLSPSSTFILYHASIRLTSSSLFLSSLSALWKQSFALFPLYPLFPNGIPCCKMAGLIRGTAWTGDSLEMMAARQARRRTAKLRLRMVIYWWWFVDL